MSTVRRVTFSLPIELAENLDYVHRRVGVSKSAFVAHLLSDGVRDLRKLLESLPSDPSSEDLVRFRGASAELAEKRVTSFLQQLED